MSEIVNNTVQTALLEDVEEAALEGRLWRSMFVAVALTVLISAPLAPWRVTTGLLLGGVLSFFNHYWLRTSLRAVFSSSTAGVSSRLVAARYVLRYVIIALVIASAYILNLISLVATIAGMCAFVAAIMLEAALLLFRAIVHGKGD
ncbi:MAG TPA: ATP synthase subunit I [Pyrinomonadaceae bacterium]|jgi:hypothetical protein|nr:ATP synthase subunit I [Pyrinomonadaceae bacterium]